MMMREMSHVAKVNNKRETRVLESLHMTEMRMIKSAAVRRRYRRPQRTSDPVEATTVKMYETHIPGFCFRKDGQFRRPSSSVEDSNALNQNYLTNLQKLLYTNDELDVQKLVCLHLLSSQVKSRAHICRKDGRCCSFVKALLESVRRSSLLSDTHRVVTDQDSAVHKMYEQLLPRYIIEVTKTDDALESGRMNDNDLSNCEDAQKQMIPIFINAEAKVILSSVVEALKMSNSGKLRELINLTISPEELRNMLMQEHVQNFISALARNPILARPTSYDYVLAYPIYDTFPIGSSMETASQVLEIDFDPGIFAAINNIRSSLHQRYAELHPVPKRVEAKQSKPRQSFAGNSPAPQVHFVESVQSVTKTPFKVVNKETAVKASNEDKNSKVQSRDAEQRNANSERAVGKPGPPAAVHTNESDRLKDAIEHTTHEIAEAEMRRPERRDDARRLSNAERILLGLKVASLKSKSVNMHRCESGKKVDIGAILSPILQPSVNAVPYGARSGSAGLLAFQSFDQGPGRQVSLSMGAEFNNMENLTRVQLAQFRQEICRKETQLMVQNFLKMNEV